MKRRWLLIGIGLFLPLTLIIGGRLWTLWDASRPRTGSPFVVDPSLIVSRAELARRGLSAGPWGDGWRDLSPAPLANGAMVWDNPGIRKAQAPTAGPAESGEAPSASGGVSFPKVTLTGPANNSSTPPGGSVTFSWRPAARAGFYFFEATGRNLRFTNPNSAFVDVRNGFGTFDGGRSQGLGAGVGFLFRGTQTSFPIRISPDTPTGAYQWRVIALDDNSNQLGVFSDAFTINIGTVAETSVAPEGGNR